MPAWHLPPRSSHSVPSAYTRIPVAPPKRKSGGRTTPKGTRPGHSEVGGPFHVEQNERGVTASSRYTPPVPTYMKESPRWGRTSWLPSAEHGLVWHGRSHQYDRSSFPEQTFTPVFRILFKPMMLARAMLITKAHIIGLMGL